MEIERDGREGRMAKEIKITQEEVNAVGSLVEAANEMDLEPFFGKDEQFSESGSTMSSLRSLLLQRFEAIAWSAPSIKPAPS